MKPVSKSKSKSQYLAVFERASAILCNASGADGVCFIDASAVNLSKGTSRRENNKSTSTRAAHFGSTRPSTTRAVSKAAPQPAKFLGLDEDESCSSENPRSSLDVSDRPPETQHFCEIISMALRTDYRAEPLQVSEAHLRRLVRRFPHGKVYTFDVQGRAISSDDSSESGLLSDSGIGSGPGASTNVVSRHLPRSKGALLNTIPDARSIVFLPLWDFAKERWNSAAIVWSTNPWKLMNIEDDLSYLTAFGNSVMNSIALLSLSVSDTAKATFLANISHELRSPLHGILGSIEFLHESPLDDFQSSMVISVETCGKTLLDTVNHVLDFSKLHNLSKATSRKKGGVTQATTSDSSFNKPF